MAGNGTASNVNTSGESNVAFDYMKKGGADCIPDNLMAEITRRILGFLESDESNDVVYTPEPPNNKQKIWVQTSAAGGIIGTIRRYDSATGEWVDDHTELPDAEDFNKFEKSITLTSADETISFVHNFGTDNYLYVVYSTTDPTPDGRWYELDKAVAQLDLKFLDMSGEKVRVEIYQTV